MQSVFGCWSLHVQEQVLLRRYLTECSAANFAGRHHRHSSSRAVAGDAARETRRNYDVRQEDFERLYERMAEQRWGVVDLVSD
jgi:hypothetical protein